MKNKKKQILHITAGYVLQRAQEKTCEIAKVIYLSNVKVSKIKSKFKIIKYAHRDRETDVKKR